jgi:hypothetical protein
VIPQRNISLLSNRLAAGGGVRIREDVLERDYCLAWFLCGLAESDLKPVLVFKGGTALKRCHFGDYRFSEDLDFTLREPLGMEATGYSRWFERLLAELGFELWIGDPAETSATDICAYSTRIRANVFHTS